MPRAKRGFKARRRRNRIMKHAKGNYGARGRTFRSAIAQVHHAWVDAYRHRRTHRREIRRLWIARINAATRMHGLSYSRFINALTTSRFWWRWRSPSSVTAKRFLAPSDACSPVSPISSSIDNAG